MKFTEEGLKKLLDMFFPKGYVGRKFEYGCPSEELWLDSHYLGWFCADTGTNWVFPLVVLPVFEGTGVEIQWFNKNTHDKKLVETIKGIIKKHDDSLSSYGEWKEGETTLTFCYIV